MAAPSEINLTLEEAIKLLNQYSCVQTKIVESIQEKEQLRQAIKLVTSLSEYENLGICADTLEEALTALSSYLQALGYHYELEPFLNEPDRGSVYLKFNTQKMSYYLDNYTGDYRGVLIACQSENDNIVGTYGHFPLNLFM